MEETKEDVKQTDSETSAETQGVKDEGEQSTEVTPSSEVINDSPDEVGDETNQSVLDETGVPWRNRAMEFKRKSEELAQSLPNLIEKAVSEAVSKQAQTFRGTRDYTIEDLEAFASANPQHKAWVEGEKEKLRMKQFSTIIDEKLQTVRQTEENNRLRQQAEAYVAKTFPDMFTRDTAGAVVGWNENHPMTRELALLMQNPKYANDPEGLAVASEIAHSRYARAQLNKAGKEAKDLKGKVKNLQKQTLVEGAGKSNPVTASPYEQSLNRLKQTGSPKDADDAIRHYLKAKGFIK